MTCGVSSRSMVHGAFNGHVVGAGSACGWPLWTVRAGYRTIPVDAWLGYGRCIYCMRSTVTCLLQTRHALGKAWYRLSGITVCVTCLSVFVKHACARSARCWCCGLPSGLQRWASVTVCPRKIGAFPARRYDNAPYTMPVWRSDTCMALGNNSELGGCRAGVQRDMFGLLLTLTVLETDSGCCVGQHTQERVCTGAAMCCSTRAAKDRRGHGCKALVAAATSADLNGEAPLGLCYCKHVVYV